MEVRALREDEREACLSLWRTVWPGDNDAYFRRYFEGDIEWLPYYTQVAVDAGRIVSAVHICKRTVACGDFRLQMGGIANVATLQEYRGKGLNSACLRAAIAVMEADAMDFSLLFTGINGYYAREGYATLPRARARGVLRENRAPRSHSWIVRPARMEDLAEIFTVYGVYNQVRPIAVQRSAAYWRDWIGVNAEKLEGPDPPLVAVDSAGRVAGYIVYQANFYRGHQITEDYAYISEFGVVTNKSVPNGDELALALLEAVAVRALASGKRELHLSIALDRHIRYALKEICDTVSENVTESGMARLLSRDGLLRSLLMEWNERWIEAGRPPGTIAFETPYGPAALDASGRFLTVAGDSDTTATLSQSALLGLIFGTISPEQTAADPTCLPLLTAIFPRHDGVYWSADGF